MPHARPARQQAHQEDASDRTAEKLKFEALLLQYDYAFKRGEITTGTVVRHESGGVLVDIGAKSLAMLPVKEASFTPGQTLEETLPEGSTHEFFILREDPQDEKFVLSRRRVFQAQTWKRLQDVMDADDVITCAISSVVKGGLLVDVQGLRGFVPSSHLRVRDSHESLVGKSLPFKILSLDQQNNNIILSHRKVVSEQLAEQRRDIFANLLPGSLVEGDVVRLTDFGAFVDLGGVDGLLPLSQMSWRWVEHPSDVLKVGDKVTVEVIGVDAEKQRVSLSIKSQFEDPWTQVSQELGLGDQVEGAITRIKHFGAFVEVFPGVEALLPNKDMADQEQQLGKKFEPGDVIAVYIIKFQPEERRISLSFRAPGSHHAAYGGERREAAAVRAPKEAPPALDMAVADDAGTDPAADQDEPSALFADRPAAKGAWSD